MVVQEDHISGLEVEDDMVLHGNLLDLFQGLGLDLRQAGYNALGILLGTGHRIAGEVHQDPSLVEEENGSNYLWEELPLPATD